MICKKYQLILIREEGNMDYIKKVYDTLKKMYPDAGPELIFADNLQLLIAVILSAQTTDKRVNAVTGDLFQKYKTVNDFAEAECSDLEKYIKSIGLASAKSRNIVACCKKIRDDFNGDIPREKSELLHLPGVGEKTANVVINVAFGKPALAIDTHVLRLSNRLGMINTKNLRLAQTQLESIVPMEKWGEMHHLLIWHGRRICHARNPACDNCGLYALCPFEKK